MMRSDILVGEALYFKCDASEAHLLVTTVSKR